MLANRRHDDGIAALTCTNKSSYETIQDQCFRNFLVSFVDRISGRHIYGAQNGHILKEPKHTNVWGRLQKSKIIRNNNIIYGRSAHETSRRQYGRTIYGKPTTTVFVKLQQQSPKMLLEKPCTYRFPWNGHTMQHSGTTEGRWPHRKRIPKELAKLLYSEHQESGTKVTR